MRKVTFVDEVYDIKKLMIFESAEGVYLFGYDCVQDTSATWDNWYLTVNEAEEYCYDNYDVARENWIFISDPCNDCQHDFIMPTKVIRIDDNKPKWGHYHTLINNKWIEKSYPYKYLDFNGLTGNERLFITGFFDEFDKAKNHDKTKARKILSALKFDKKSIEQIL